MEEEFVFVFMQSNCYEEINQRTWFIIIVVVGSGAIEIVRCRRTFGYLHELVRIDRVYHLYFE
jgi:hypothetical protein